MTKEEDLLGVGYSFGFTGFNNDKQKAIGTMRVETKLCYLAYLDPANYYLVMNKHKIRRDEKLL